MRLHTLIVFLAGITCGMLFLARCSVSPAHATEPTTLTANCDHIAGADQDNRAVAVFEVPGLSPSMLPAMSAWVCPGTDPLPLLGPPDGGWEPASFDCDSVSLHTHGPNVYVLCGTNAPRSQRLAVLEIR